MAGRLAGMGPPVTIANRERACGLWRNGRISGEDLDRGDFNSKRRRQEKRAASIYSKRTIIFRSNKKKRKFKSRPREKTRKGRRPINYARGHMHGHLDRGTQCRGNGESICVRGDDVLGNAATVIGLKADAWNRTLHKGVESIEEGTV